MFKSVTPLDSNIHRDLKLAPNPGFGFAAKTMTVPLALSEVIEASKAFPIVFPNDGPLIPHALLSLTDGRNEFVSETGEWTGTYIPAHVRRYPFILAATGNDKGDFILAFDADAPHFKNGTQPLFNAEGQPTELVTQVLQFLNNFQGDVTSADSRLDGVAALLEAQQLQWQPPKGEKQVVNGFRVVNLEKLEKLSDKKFLELRKSGALPIIYAHLASLSNVSRLTEKAALRLAAA